MSNCNNGVRVGVSSRGVGEKRFPQVKVDASLISHTSNPEYEKLKYDSTMEALRDRTIKIDVPFLKEWKKQLEEEENAKCCGKNEIIVDYIGDEIHTFEIQEVIQHEKLHGFEHLHVDTDFSLLDGFAEDLVHTNLRTNDGVHCAICLADWNNGEWSPECPSCQDCNYVRSERPSPEAMRQMEQEMAQMGTVVEVSPQYEGHPVGTPPPQTQCTCDIMLLMAQGCKCGWLDLEKKAQAEAAFEKERHQDLNSGGW